MLSMIPGLELVPLEESEICCGAAGTYNLTQPEMSAAWAAARWTGPIQYRARMLATGNVGCILQIARKIKESGSRIEVAHPIDLLDRAYRGE
ncbi:MAG: (Fe-S)-binding protein [Isosphaeraceae bacterium]